MPNPFSLPNFRVISWSPLDTTKRRCLREVGLAREFSSFLADYCSTAKPGGRLLIRSLPQRANGSWGGQDSVQRNTGHY